jgi:hypothetical protein
MLFEDAASPTWAAGPKASRIQPHLVRRLEAELPRDEDAQQPLIEQIESGNEELKVADKDVLSMNEELYRPTRS